MICLYFDFLIPHFKVVGAVKLRPLCCYKDLILRSFFDKIRIV